MKNLKPQHQDTLIGQAVELKKAITYHLENIAPFYNQMEKWEEKEYKAVYNNNVENMNKFKTLIMGNEKAFNNILSDYNLTSTIFIAKYLN